jgi:glycerophosphoryl diester phosphodiesterase
MAPVVIAHRGASGYRPEHTLAGYTLAARMGADYIEQDLVATKDGVLVCRHENEISGSTDIADRPEFADRRTTKTIDGREQSGWFTEDLTLAELKTLRARERIPELRPRNTLYDGRDEVPTLDEVIELATRLGVGIYPETKHPSYFRAIGLPLEEPLVAALEAFEHAVFVQSFEADSLQRIGERLDVPLVHLLTHPADLDDIATYAHAVGPRKELVDEEFVEAAHGAGLAIHPWTFRNENAFLPPELRSSDDDPAAYGDAFAEYERFLTLGVDGLFTDNTDTAVEALSARRR